MSVKSKIKSKKLYDRGNEALLYRIEIPQIDGLEEINSFYGSISEECEKYCNGILLDFVCEDRREDRRARYSYGFTAVVTHYSDGLVSVLAFACLRRGNETLSRYACAHTWDTSDSCMLPPRCVYKRIGGDGDRKKLKRSELEGVFLLNGEIRNIKNADVEGILSEYRVKYAIDLQ